MGGIARRIGNAVLRSFPSVLHNAQASAEAVESLRSGDARRAAAAGSDDAGGAEDGGGAVAGASPHVFASLQYLRKLCSHPGEGGGGSWGRDAYGVEESGEGQGERGRCVWVCGCVGVGVGVWMCTGHGALVRASAVVVAVFARTTPCIPPPPPLPARPYAHDRPRTFTHNRTHNRTHNHSAYLSLCALAPTGMVLDLQLPAHRTAANAVLRTTEPTAVEAALRRGGLRHAPKLAALRDILATCGVISPAADDAGGGEAAAGGAAEGGAGAGGAAGADDDAGGGGGSGGGSSGHRLLVFAQHKALLDLVERDLLAPYGVSYLRLDGGVEAGARFAVVQRFNADPTIDVLLLTTGVGGVGLNLTAADTVVFLEHDWNPMKDMQVGWGVEGSQVAMRFECGRIAARRRWKW